VSAVHFGTFDVEAAWRPPGLAGLPSGPVRAGAGDMDHLLAAGCAPDDVLLVASPPPPATRDAWTAAGITPTVIVVPGDGPIEHRIARAPAGSLPDVAGRDAVVYAVRDGTHEAVGRLGLKHSLPALPDVVRVNAKTWSNAFVVEQRLAGAAVVATSADEVRRYAEPGSVVKDPYGVAGRGALHLSTPRIADTVVRHLERQVARGARVELLVQPWFDVAMSFSAHLMVDGAGGHEWLGLQRAESTGFAYRGSGPLPDDGLRALLRPILADLAAAIAAEGYTGPVCVDGLRLRDGTVIPVLEVNARQSMGLLNLHLDRRAAARGGSSRLRTGPAPDGALPLTPRFHAVLD
jgi:hypothetical protein